MACLYLGPAPPGARAIVFTLGHTADATLQPMRPRKTADQCKEEALYKQFPAYTAVYATLLRCGFTNRAEVSEDAFA